MEEPQGAEAGEAVSASDTPCPKRRCPNYRRRSFEQIRAEERELTLATVGDALTRLALRVRMGRSNETSMRGAPDYSGEAARDAADILRAAAGSIRAGVFEPEPHWPQLELLA